MEFDEMQKIWDTQNDELPYVIDEKVLQKRIQRKRHSVLVNISDWLSIIGYLVSTSLLAGRHPFTPGANIFLYLAAVWSFAIVVYLVVSHIRRITVSRRFDRSIHGDLDHAIYLISYQMRTSLVLRWHLLPLGAIMIFSCWKAGKLFFVSAIISVIVLVNTGAFYASVKSYSANKRRKHKLQVLKEKLENSSI